MPGASHDHWMFLLEELAHSPPWRSAARQLVETAALASLSESPKSSPLGVIKDFNPVSQGQATNTDITGNASSPGHTARDVNPIAVLAQRELAFEKRLI